MTPMEVVHVRFAGAARSTACAAEGEWLEVGDRCIVRTPQGPTFGVVTQALLDNPFYDERHAKEIPSILRRAQVEDEEAYARKISADHQAHAFCARKITERGLKMKLGKVDQQLDGKKMIFHFTSESRVDFRGLVRDLAAEFRTRIELKQIGARDDASMQGGCGSCGRSLCCSTHLRRFEPVSVKMAKLQGLSLNPSKISGMCGRLMCCLKYEYDPDAPKPKKGKKRGCGVPPKAAGDAADGKAGDARAGR